MNAKLTTLAMAVTLIVSSQAEDMTIRITETHLCCKGCVNAANEAVKKIEGVTANADQESRSITLTGPDPATIKKGMRALANQGFYGKSNNPKANIKLQSGAKNEKVKSLTVAGVHLCCGACVKAVNKALESVPGVEANTAEKDAKKFEITGNFNDQAVFDALHKAGMHGRVPGANRGKDSEKTRVKSKKQ